MTFPTLIVIILLAVLCSRLKWQKMSLTLYVMSALLFLGIGCGPIPIWLTTRLQSSYEDKPVIQWKKRNAIVLLGAGTTTVPSTTRIEPNLLAYARIVQAATCYRACHKMGADCKIIISGGDPVHHGLSEAFVYKQVLIKLGVLPTEIWQEGLSLNTWQNAQLTQPLLQRYRPDQVLLVSAGLHLYRGALYFSHFGIDTTPIRADFTQGILSLLPISYNFTMTDFALHEYLGIARYYVYTKLGWNPRRLNKGDV